ncbi:nuclear transport factor 2 family protein [Novosphingobium sp. KCTC 2891]|uniref:nuclear transport factor 2 family protein n=1 Tax=Novosphingobium sp. KCTC 2891 TaxID=2989730 RepID=UPI002221FD63|nr:nuclear transport factor 2 family protein [Novosphingobium sp. KCTC 2891]MCW1384862.1 nuclear transport factor 2 family protein [Novosphingobium sp. KCTC 2891]
MTKLYKPCGTTIFHPQEIAIRFHRWEMRMLDASIEFCPEIIESRLKHLEDKDSIISVMNRYSRALDWLDDRLIEDVFFDDAQIDYGFFKGKASEFRPILMEVERTSGRRWHFTAQVSIELDGDVAHASAYNLSMAADTVGSTPPAALGSFFGYYVDRFERRDGVWNIAARRHLLIAGTQWQEIEITGPLAALNTIGATSSDHPHYRRMA